MKIDELPIIAFADQKAWSSWLEEHHADTSGVWVRFYKKSSSQPTVTYDEALDEALCFGWIDGQVKKYDDESYLQKFTPRRARSIWSKRNIDHIERLTKEGRMQPAGLQQVEAAKADGRWEQAYDSPSQMTIPDDFLAEVKKDSNAYAFFQRLNRANLYSIAWRLQTAKKPETRAKRMSAILSMLAEGKKFH
jgi:uncharacterized protein YdeI (YjbR/CyaY-like superfamily)